MRIQRLKLKDFRNYDALEISLAPGVNLFYGPNGSGKTNLLEAVHYCALGRSHRTSQDKEVIRRDMPMGACGVTLEKADGLHDVAVKMVREGDKKKQVFLNGKKAPRLAAMMGTLQCVIFSPEDLELIKDGPSIRRKFLDMLLSQLSTGYFTALQGYQTALNQRNSLLRALKFSPNPRAGESLFIWEDAMARAAQVLLPERENCCQRLATEAAARYQSISGKTDEAFTVQYLSCLPEKANIYEQTIHQLQLRREEDIRRGTTSFGPHREDIALYLQGKEMKMYASQGQIRTAALALKLSELTIFQQLSGESPVLLLDDVMSELDFTRRSRLLSEIQGIQTLITCTDERDIGEKETYTGWQVKTTPASPAQVHRDTPPPLKAPNPITDDFLNE